MNDQKTKTVFEDRDRLIVDKAEAQGQLKATRKILAMSEAEIDRLKAENKSIGDKLVRACMESGELRVRALRAEEALQQVQAELETARKVADAVVKWFDCEDEDEIATWNYVVIAVDEYREVTEAQVVMSRPGVRRGMEKLEGMD